MKRFLVLGFLLLGVLSSLALAQEPAASILANLPAADKYPNANALYLEKNEEITINADGTFTQSLHKRIWILTPDGVDPNSAFYQYYDSRTGSLHLDYARTIHPDGTVTNIFPFSTVDAFVSQLLESQGMPTVPDTEDKILYFQLPAVEEGTIVDWRMTTSGRDPLIPGEVSDVFYLSGTIPTKSESLTVKVAHGAHVSLDVVGSDIKPVVQTTSQATTYTFTATDVPAMADEPSMPALSVVAPRVVITTLTHWDQLANAYQNMFATAITPDPSITEMVQTISCHLITRGYFDQPEIKPIPETTENSPQPPCEDFTLPEKVAALYDFVSTDIDNSGTARYFIPPAEMTLSHHAGDCKGKAALLIAMLKVLGVTAYPALINTESGADIDLSLPPTLAAINHVIVAMKQDDTWRFLDPTAGDNHFLDYLPPPDRDKHAIVLMEEKDRPWALVPTDVTTTKNNRVQSTMDVYPSPGRDCIVQAYITAEGKTVYSLNSDFSIGKDDQAESKYEKLMSYDIRGVHNLNFEPSFSTMPEVKTTASFSVPSHENSQGGFSFMLPYPPPCPTPTQLFASLGEEPRIYPYITSPERISVSARVSVPRGMKIVRLPINIDVQNELGHFTSSYNMDETGHLLIARTLVMDVHEVAPSKVSLLRRIFLAMYNDEHTVLMFAAK